MRFFFTAALAYTLVTLSTTATAADAVNATKQIAVHCGHLIDTQAGKLLGETTVVVEGKRIAAVVAGYQAPAGAAGVDLSSQFCMPGLIDSHTHLSLEITPAYYTEQFRL